MKAQITIPDNINEISLGQYQKFLSVADGLDGEFLNQRTVEIFCQVPFARVILMKRQDVKDIAEHITALIGGKAEFIHRFKIKTQEFGFMPDMENMSSGEFADLTAYIGKEENLHKAMAVMFRPITTTYKDKYDISKYNGSEEFGDLMKFMPLGVALGAVVFFYNLTSDLLNATQHSILAEVVKEITAEHHNSVKNGDSTKTSTHSLKEILDDLMKLQPLVYTNV